MMEYGPDFEGIDIRAVQGADEYERIHGERPPVTPEEAGIYGDEDKSSHGHPYDSFSDDVYLEAAAAVDDMTPPQDNFRNYGESGETGSSEDAVEDITGETVEQTVFEPEVERGVE